MSYQDTYSQLPPGLDPANLARLAQQTMRQGAISRQAQAQELPPDQTPAPQQPQQRPQQTAEADTGDTTADAATKPEAEPPAAPAAEPPPGPEAAPAPTQVAAVDPLTGRFSLPQLQQRNEPYVPSSARPPRMWGTDSWAMQAFAFNPMMQYGPFMPAPQEVYGIIRGAGAQMVRWGAPSYGQYYGQASVMATAIGPMLDALTGGRFTKGFNAARLGALRVQQEQMKVNLQQALQQHQQFLKGASDILDFYVYGGEKGSEAEALETAKQKMEDYLNQTGHQNLINMLHTRGMKGVVEYLTYEDQKYLDSLHAHTSLKKATGASDEEKDRAFEGGDTVDPNSPEARRERAGAPAPDKAPDPLAPKTPTLGESGDIDADIKKAFPGATDREIEAARTFANTGKAPDVGRVKKARIEGIAEGLNTAVERAAGREDGTEDKLKRIATIDPLKAAKLRGLINYDADPKDPENKKLVGLAQQVSNGNYREGNYAVVQDYTRPSTDVGRSVRRVGTLSASLPHALQAINQLKENETMPGRVFEKLWDGDFKGVDDRYVQVYNAMRPIVLESVALESGSGRPAVTTQHDMMKEFFLTRSPRMMRSLVANEARNAYGTAVQLNSQFRQLVGDPTVMAPGMFRYGMQDLNAIAHMNSTTGELPPGSPESIKYAGKDVKPPTLPPLKTYAREELDRYRRVYQGLPPHDPDRDFILKQLEDIF